jgi:hypothetical protein
MYNLPYYKFVRSVKIIIAIVFLAGVALAAGTAGVRKVSYDQFAAAGGEPKSRKVTLDPTRGWLVTDVYVKEGDFITLAATGLVDPGVRMKRGPDGEGSDPVKEMTHECPYMQLLGRIGDGMVFCVGSAATFEVTEGGAISFHVNELDMIRFDDSGHFDITIRWITPAAKSGASSSGPASSQGPVMTAGLDLVPLNVSPSDATAISAQVRANLSASGRYIVIDPQQVENARVKLKIAKPDLASPANAARIGRELNAGAVITGQVGKIGNAYSVTLQRVNPSTAAVENSVAEVMDCPLEQLPARLSALVKKL